MYLNQCPHWLNLHLSNVTHYQLTWRYILIIDVSAQVSNALKLNLCPLVFSPGIEKWYLLVKDLSNKRILYCISTLTLCLTHHLIS